MQHMYTGKHTTRIEQRGTTLTTTATTVTAAKTATATEEETERERMTQQ